MTKEYCIYCDEFFDKSLMNKEHIIPKNIGGELDFFIYVNAIKNSVLGSKIDKPYTDSNTVKLLGKDYAFTGHSKSEVPTFQNAIITDTQELVNIFIKKNKATVYKRKSKNSPSWKKELNQLNGKELEINGIINNEDYVRFYAKLFLATGYYLYRDVFVKNGYHNDLRTIMNSNNPEKLFNDNAVKSVIYYSTLSRDPFIKVFNINENIFNGYHAIWSSITSNGVTLGVSIFGNIALTATCKISDDPKPFDNGNMGTLILKGLKDNDRGLYIKTMRDVLNI